jgi:hypothetical protein
MSLLPGNNSKHRSPSSGNKQCDYEKEQNEEKQKKKLRKVNTVETITEIKTKNNRPNK